ncbi:pantothenate kinase [Stutzerimonas stutzeri]|uniref:Type III pantothenate kinase n=1 Tax=Stutzerimonas stutzeri TaxID=316 RepID=A0A2S4AQ84_STUST|nr:type III pantothenate kinase [Stutzerimonas stutzeri]MCQ4265562.1 type III pantothenate kinase [Stutzerimonas stutzeri]POH83643.1 pantothenate kinase [Stutzerimonas stutzeri]
MILELDCGNSLIKWRVLEVGSAVIVAQGASVSIGELLGELVGLSVLRISRARLVSVRSDEETMALCSRLSEVLAIEVVRAVPAKELAGVINGYEDYKRLGMDRWLAIIGAFQIARGALLVLDLGTAVTADLVDANGVHLGGYICPGISLLRHQLHTHTRRISYSAEAAASGYGAGPGRSTAEAVERGCLMMLRSFVGYQISQASDYLGSDFAIYVTGGDAELIENCDQVTRVPDLVFRGLAIACP